jgi:hypothetical protein
LDAVCREQLSPHLPNKFPLPHADTFHGVSNAILSGGYNAIELGPGSNTQTFVKTMSLEGVEGWQNNLHKTSHHNLVNVVDIYADDVVYLLYERMGISLRDLKRCSSALFDKITVATVCTEVREFCIFYRREADRATTDSTWFRIHP